MNCDKCNKTTDTVYNKMPLCGDCVEKVKEYRKKRNEPSPPSSVHETYLPLD